jgi:hypothetical protein
MTPSNNLEEAWIEKYRTALEQIPPETSRMEKIRQFVLGFGKGFVSRVASPRKHTHLELKQGPLPGLEVDSLALHQRVERGRKTPGRASGSKPVRQRTGGSESGGEKRLAN